VNPGQRSWWLANILDGFLIFLQTFEDVGHHLESLGQPSLVSWDGGQPPLSVQALLNFPLARISCTVCLVGRNMEPPRPKKLCNMVDSVETWKLESSFYMAETTKELLKMG